MSPAVVNSTGGPFDVLVVEEEALVFPVPLSVALELLELIRLEGTWVYTSPERVMSGAGLSFVDD